MRAFNGWVLVVVAATSVGCFEGDDESSCAEDPASCFDGGSRGMDSVGKECSSSADCAGALRLSCVDDKCAFTEDLAAGDPCNVTLECGEGLFCNVDDGSRRCDAAGTAKAGELCKETADCQRNLTCAFDSGLAKHCVTAGDAGPGAMCSSGSDCLAGLLCAPTGPGMPSACVQVAPGSIPFVPWEGVSCAKDDASPTAYFEVPRGTADDGDFYRLPFPNDVRRTSAGLSLTRFPSPGDRLGVGVDFVGAYVRAAEKLDGFSTNPVVYFRFSHGYKGVGEASVLVLDIDPDSPSYDSPLSRTWHTSVGDVTGYVCPNWLNVRMPVGQPLRPGNTYAVILTNAITPSKGGTFARSKDLDALLAKSAPSDAKLKAAYAAYAPLRAYLADADRKSKITAANVLNAAVFTTQNPLAVIEATRAVIRGLDVPTVKDVTVCAEGVKSPCDDGDQRVCGAASATFAEIHGRISLPIFQAGKAPYETQGGGFELDGAGKPKLQRREDVCFGLTVPKKAAGEAGYPLVIYAHGTGGSFKSGIHDLAGTATAAGAAVLTIDLPAHGSRKNGSKRSEAELFYNFANPAAARDNVTQGSADLMSLVHWATQFSASESSAFERAVKFDAAKIALFGHSQGATHASLMAPIESDLVGVVFSGLGGALSEGLVSKRSPIDIAANLWRVLGDEAAAPTGELCPPELDELGKPRMVDGKLVRYPCIGSQHPVYDLMQTFFDRVDPVNFGPLLPKPASGMTPKHVMMTFGLGDTYAPEPTQRAYVVSAKLAQVGPSLYEIEPKRAVVDAPLSANVAIGEHTVTQGMRQYMPTSGTDGHFVYAGPAKEDWARFLTALLQGKAPQIGK